MIPVSDSNDQAGSGKTASERNEMRRACRCVHFNGVQNDACKLGIRYDSFSREKAIPCILKMTHMNEQNQCAQYQKPTLDELKAEDRKFDQMFADVNKARKAIIEHAGNKTRVGGNFPCPICVTGKLGYSIASNRHVHARCSTEGCVSWME